MALLSGDSFWNQAGYAVSQPGREAVSLHIMVWASARTILETHSVLDQPETTQLGHKLPSILVS